MRRSGLAVGALGLVALGAAGLWLANGDTPSTTPRRLAAAAAASARPAPVSPWTKAQFRDLLAAIEGAAGEGLRPSDYQLAAVRSAVDAGRTSAEVDALADAAALSLAHDFAAGHVRDRHRFNWYIDDAGPASATTAKQVADAREGGRLAAWLRGLLPDGADYRALRAALADAPAADGERRDRILANMERWRWLPRDIGRGDQLYVNLPTYQLDVVEDGRTTATYKAVIGATDMPTPALSATVRQVIANPDWIVPPSIVRRSHLRPGASSRYIFTTRPDGTLRVRQKPGPGNALGRVKIEFPNRLAIYFHDTPSKSLFGASERAFSHGCVRVQRVEALASSIVASPDRFAAALAGTRTQSFRTARQWRATIVYLTLTRGDDGAVRFVGDPYRMDAALAAALEGRKPRPAAPPPVVPVPKPTGEPEAPPPVDASPAPVEPDPAGNGLDAPIAAPQP